jgi:hypothetical protein
VTSSVLLIGLGLLADATERALRAGGADVARLQEPDDSDVREALEEDVDHVVVISRSDVVSLRLALVVEHIRPGCPMLVTIFGRGMAEQVESAVENVSVISMGDIVAPSFAGPGLDPEYISVVETPYGAAAVKALNDSPQCVALAAAGPGRARRLLDRLASLVWPFDASARILVAGLLGLVAVLAIETIVTAATREVGLVDAFYVVTKVTTTVGPSGPADQGPEWFKLFSAAGMLLILGFTAVFTAGLVNRLLDRRLNGILGRSAVPRRDHVIVVGLGQVGLRLCGMLRELDVPVVAVEQDPEARNVIRAKENGLPVVIGSGSNRRLLRRLSLARARSLAAVTSDEVENIGIAVTARAMREDLPVALRAGDGDATSETSSLFGIGVIRDVYRIAGTAIAAAALGHEARQAFPHEGLLYLVDGAGEIEPFVPVDGTVGAPPSRREPARGPAG